MSRPDIPGYSVNQFNSVMSPNYGVPADNRTLATYPTVPTVWSGGRQRPVVSEGEQRSILASTGMLAAGVFAAGAIPLKQGRVWDKYIGAAQFVEQVSPGQILTTFRTSEILSPLETVSRGATMWGGDFWQTPEKQKYLEKLLGKDAFGRHKKDILASGLKLDKGRLKIGGQAGATVLSRATKLRAHRDLGQAEFFKNYARAIGVDDLGFTSRDFMPIGGKTMLGAYSRFGYASVTEMTNRILRVAPTEITELPMIRDLFRGKESARGSLGYQSPSYRAYRKIFPKARGSLTHKAFRTVFPAIKPGAAHQTIRRYLMKRVVPAVALFKGLQYADYLTDNTLSGLALGAYSQTKIMKARLMEATGLQQLAERQEEIAPGSTSLLGLAAIPMKGAMLGFGAYGLRLGYTAAQMRKPGIGAAAAAAKGLGKFKEAKYETFFGLGKKLGIKNIKQRTLASALRRTGALAGLAYIAPFLPGAIAGTDTAEELEAVYSGEKEVAIRKGKYWEAGRTPYEGGRIQYFRKHAIPTFLSRGKVKAIYGSEERKMELDPMLLWNWFDFLQNPYQWEQEHYYEFPFPMVSPAFEDVPLIGPMLAGTIGKMIKKPMLMHTEEWMRQQSSPMFGPAGIYQSGQSSIPTGQMTGELEGYGYGPGQGGIGYRGLMEVKRLPKPFGQQAAYELGEIPPGLPVDPYSPLQLFGEQAYRFTEASGLYGFTLTSFKGALTGTEEFYDQYERLETARRATGIEAAYWGLQIGGGALSTELFRRLYPHRRRNIDLYNPIRNLQPEWLPGAGEPAPDLLHGYSYGKVLEGEVRLPGRGLCLHPDTKINTIDSFVPIKDILIGNEVLTSDGYKKVINTFSRQYDSDLISITSYGSLIEPTKLTEDHLVKTVIMSKCKYHKSSNKKRRPCKYGNFCVKMMCSDYENNEIEWIKAKNLEEGDYVLLPRLEDQLDSFTIDVPSEACDDMIEYVGNDEYQCYRILNGKRHKSKKISLEINDSDDMWFLFGLWLAEGSIGKSKIGFALHKDETYLADLIGKYFDCKTYKKKDANCIVTYVHNKILSIYIEKVFGRASNKCIPRNLSRQQFLMLLSGWIQGDGHCDKESKRLTMSTKYKQLYSDLMYLMTIYNIDYSVTTRDRTLTLPQGTIKDVETHEIRIMASSMKELSFMDYKDKKSTDILSKTSSNFEIDGHRAFKIKKIEREYYEGLVHDIEVEDIHEYTTSFIVHNSAMYPELEGVAPDDYSAIWRYKILADVAPYAPQTKFYKQMVQGLRTQGSLSERDEEIYQMIQDQLQQKKVFKEFKDRHRFIKQETDVRTVTIAKMLSPSTFEIEEMPGVAISMAGLKTSQAALSRLAMTENNQLTQDEAKIRANQKRMRAARELGDIGIRPGEQVEIEIGTDVLRQYAKTGSKRPEIRAVVRTAEGVNINKMMLEGQLAEYDKASAGVLEGQVAYNLFEQLTGAYWEGGMRVIDDPSEFLTPFSPFHKFLGTKTRTAAEEYAAAEAYGTTNAFWDRPWDNFLRPMFHYLGYKLGGTDLPEHIMERNEIDEYYDKLKYIKFTRLKNLAAASGNTEAAEEYEKLRRKTAFGADPYGNPLNALLALQKRDKPYFDSFAQASTESERELIMKMFPEYEKHLLRARWNSEMLGQLYAEKKVKGSLSTEQYEMIEEIQKLRMAEGQAIDPGAMEAYEDYVSDVGQTKAADYADFQRQRSLNDYFRDRPLPKQDWVAWSPMVDLEDIKLVAVRNEGRDIHDFNLWESREKLLPYKPYIDEEAIAQVTAENADMSSADIQMVLQDILASYGMQNVNITVDKFLRKDPQNLIDLDITRDPLQAGFENAVKQGWI